jgi:hypothetical protein
MDLLQEYDYQQTVPPFIPLDMAVVIPSPRYQQHTPIPTNLLMTTLTADLVGTRSYQQHPRLQQLTQ